MALAESVALTLSVGLVVAALQLSNIEPPRKIHDVRPAYPPESLRRGDEGIVMLEVRVNASGAVESAEGVWSGCRHCDRAALEAIRQWRYAPVLRNGEPVPWLMTIQLPFRLPERLKSRAGRTGACKWTEGPKAIR